MSRIRTDDVPTTPGTVIDVEVTDPETGTVSWERHIRIDTDDVDNWLSLDDHDLWSLAPVPWLADSPIRWQLVSVPVTETEGHALIAVGGFNLSPTVMILHGGNDMESHARSFNQGYSTALVENEPDFVNETGDEPDAPDYPTFVYEGDEHKAILITEPGYRPMPGTMIQIIREKDLRGVTHTLIEVDR